MSASAAALSSTRQRPHWLDVVADPVRLQIIRALSQVAEATASELAISSQASYQTLRRHLEVLEACNVIDARPGQSDGETGGRPATRFSLSPSVRDSVSSVFGTSP